VTEKKKTNKMMHAITENDFWLNMVVNVFLKRQKVRNVERIKNVFTSVIQSNNHEMRLCKSTHQYSSVRRNERQRLSFELADKRDYIVPCREAGGKNWAGHKSLVQVRCRVVDH